MKLVLLRHEQRDLLEPRFFCPLTDQGQLNAKSSIFLEKIKNLKPDIIFCSPFERCIQTISTFCLQDNKNICIENSLYEFVGNSKFINEPVYDISNIKDFYEQLINFEYDSFLKINQFNFAESNRIFRLESPAELFIRVANFIEEIFKQYMDTNKTILIVSHEGVIKQIETYLYKYVLQISKRYKYIQMGELREFNLKYQK